MNDAAQIGPTFTGLRSCCTGTLRLNESANQFKEPRPWSQGAYEGMRSLSQDIHDHRYGIGYE